VQIPTQKHTQKMCMTTSKPKSSMLTSSDDSEEMKFQKRIEMILRTINEIKKDTNKCLNEFLENINK
jgi:hypothetical protein